MKKKSDSSNIKVILIAVSILAIIVALTVIINITNKIPENNPLLVGNTAGNLNNTGLFCEAEDGKIYFSNAYDSGSLYSMNADQTEVKKLYDGSCQYINDSGDYLYFSMASAEGGTGLGYVLKTSGIYRAKKNGNKINAISETPSVIMALNGNDLYFQASTGDGIGLKKMDISQKKPEETVVENTDVMNPACIVDGKIYYNGTQTDHYLYVYDPATDSATPVWGGDVWNPVYDGGYFYYMDISNDYKVCRYSPTAQTVDVLTTDRVDTFNVGYGYIYYSTSTSEVPGIYRVTTNGTNCELIAQGIYNDINMTSSYTYFHSYDSDTPMYCIQTTGANYVSEFTAASEAVK